MKPSPESSFSAEAAAYQTPIDAYLDLEQPFDQEEWAEEPKARCECAVFGIYGPGINLAIATARGLNAMQNRGEEAVGMTIWTGKKMERHAETGLVREVFKEPIIKSLSAFNGDSSLGHVRYSTSGEATRDVEFVQPLREWVLGDPYTLAHNGNLTNSIELKKYLRETGLKQGAETDTKLLSHLITQEYDGNWAATLKRVNDRIEGAASFVVQTEHALYGVRDHSGFRPLCVGVDMTTGGAFAISSESGGLKSAGFKRLREVLPGEIVRIDEFGITRESAPATPVRPASFCKFEYIYFALSESRFGDGESNVGVIRYELGRELAREAPVEADVVICAPDTAREHAQGYAFEAGIPFREGLKRHGSARSFTQPDPGQRTRIIEAKFNPIIDIIKGKRVILIDDSIVRGNTMPPLVRMLFDAGATEVHLRIASSAIISPCYMGIDMSTTGELVANRVPDVADRARRFNADSLYHLSETGSDKVLAEFARDAACLCRACFTGEYPIPVKDLLNNGEIPATIPSM